MYDKMVGEAQARVASLNAQIAYIDSQIEEHQTEIDTLWERRALLLDTLFDYENFVDEYGQRRVIDVSYDAEGNLVKSEPYVAE